MYSCSILRYAHENGAPWDEYTCAHAAYNGHLECLKYAHENGAHWDEKTPVLTCLNVRTISLRYWDVVTSTFRGGAQPLHWSLKTLSSPAS